MATLQVTKVPSGYFNTSEILADLSKEMPANINDLPVTRMLANKMATVIIKADYIQQAIAREVARRLITDDNYTPRKSGHLRFNWQVQLNKTNNNELFVEGDAYSDEVAYSKARAVLAKAKKSDIIRIFNNASYAKKAESTGWKGSNGGSHPPYGMLKKVINEFPSIVNEVMASLEG